LPIERIVSGGQTGVDRAALDVALELGLPCGGWCPRGRLAEDGPIDPRYPLRETTSADYAQRTELNVRDSDGTLILTVGTPTGGTLLTKTTAERLEKPLFLVDFEEQPAVGDVLAWVERSAVRELNVAGPRASQQPGIDERARTFLRALLRSEA